MIMDDYTLDLNMVAQFDKDINVTGIEKINIPDMIITDDENRILYSSSNQKSIDFCNSFFSSILHFGQSVLYKVTFIR